MKKLVDLIASEDNKLSEKISEILKNNRSSKSITKKKDELKMLSIRYEGQLERKSVISGYPEIIANLKKVRSEEIKRFILIGLEEAFVFYTDINEKQLLGFYKMDL